MNADNIPMGQHHSVGRAPSDAFREPGKGIPVIVETAKGAVRAFQRKPGGPATFR